MATNEQHYFSTGKLRIGLAGNVALTDAANLLADVQDVTLDINYNAVDLMTNAQTSLFPVDVAFHDGKAGLKSTVKDLDRLIFAFLLGLAATTAGGVDTFTILATTKPQLVRVEFIGYENTAQKTFVVAFTRAYSPSIGMAFKLKDFTDVALDFHAIADPNATTPNAIGTISIQQ